MDRPTCKTCSYYVPLDNGSHKDTKGHCVRYAPHPYIRPANHNHFQGYDQGPAFVVPVHPMVREKFGCGEHPEFPKYIKSLEGGDA